MESELDVHVQAKLFTKLKRYTIQEAPFSLPSSSGCLELNSLLKGILFSDGSAQHAHFDFLIGDKFLRTTINEFIAENNVSTESVLEIEYILKDEAPRLHDSLLHDDWVSSIDMTNDLIVTGSYDNTVSIWNLNGKCLSAMEGHTMAVKHVSWISCTKEGGTYVSASQDQTVLMWQFDRKTNKNECIHICRGHAGSVDCLAIQPSLKKFASGSWDKIIKIWNADINPDAADEDEDEDSGPKKKRAERDRTISNRIPLVSLTGHKEPVSCLQWSEDNELMSSGWDHCIRLWDLQSATNKHTLTGNKVILSISFSKQNKLLASGSTDKFVRLWDPRTKDGAVVKTVLSSHDGWVSSVQWSPISENHISSASYDNSVKLWDIRNVSSALFDLEKHEDKVMSLCWKESDTILSGGADCKVHVYRKGETSPITSEE